MQKVIAVTLVALFVALGTMVVVGAASVLFREKTATVVSCLPTPCTLPPAPELPSIPPAGTDTSTYSHQVTAYQQQVMAYKDRLSAYEKYLAAWNALRDDRSARATLYQAVVKDALLPILNPLVMAFIAYALVKGAANVVHNVMAARKENATLEKLDL